MPATPRPHHLRRDDDTDKRPIAFPSTPATEPQDATTRVRSRGLSDKTEVRVGLGVIVSLLCLCLWWFHTRLTTLELAQVSMSTKIDFIVEGIKDLRATHTGVAHAP